MSFKQNVFLGVTLLSSVAVIGASVQSTTAAASKRRGKKVTKVSKTYRTKATKVSHKAYYSLSKTGKTYKLSGTLKKPVLKSNHALKNYTKTTWTRSKQMFVTKKGKKTRYYYVKAAKNKAAGWVKASQLKAGKNGQATTAKKTAAKAYYKNAKSGKVYQLTGKNSYVAFKQGVKLVADQKYTRTQKRTVYKKNKKTTYYYVKAGQTKGWVWNGYLTTKAPVVPEPTVSGLTTLGETVDGITSYNVAGNTIDPYKSEDFSTVDVPSDYALARYKYQYSPTYKAKKTLQTKSETLSVVRHTGADSDYALKSTMYLPLDGQSTKGINSNPQSATFSKDDHYLYVMYVDKSGKGDDAQMGWVIRYDWQKLTALGTRKNGQMQLIRKAAVNQYHNKATSKDKAILKCIKVGPTFNTGHAQSLALNPRTNELWFVKKHQADDQSTVERLNPETLKPDAAVNFTLKSGMHMGSVLAFDNDGNAYYWTHTLSAWPTAPLNSAKIYKGQISTDRVHFNLVMQGLSRVPGEVVQSMSYNGANNRLYLVSNGSIFSVPVDKLGQLDASDVSATNFTGDREFEGMMFMHQSNQGFVLTNRGPAILQMTN